MAATEPCSFLSHRATSKLTECGVMDELRSEYERGGARLIDREQGYSSSPATIPSSLRFLSQSFLLINYKHVFYALDRKVRDMLVVYVRDLLAAKKGGRRSHMTAPS